MSDNSRVDEIIIKRGELCGWCGVTDALTPMQQGGFLHTMCDSCGTSGRLVETNEFTLSYTRLLRLARELEEENTKLRRGVQRLEKENMQLVYDIHCIRG